MSRCSFGGCRERAQAIAGGWPFCPDCINEHHELVRTGDVRRISTHRVSNRTLSRADLLAAVLAECGLPVEVRATSLDEARMLRVACPECGAEANRWCELREGVSRFLHAERFEAWSSLLSRVSA